MTKQKILKPDLLAITTRGNSIETTHYGWICVMDKDKKIIYKKGDITDKVFLRSSLKPLQALTVVKYIKNITDKELAIICGSHSGSKSHLLLLKAFMKKQNIQLSNLQCSSHSPFDEIEKNNLIRNTKRPSPLHNNCSGKHLGMIAVCKKNKWDLKTYIKYNHPVQKEILHNLKNLSKSKLITRGIDGCRAPTYSICVNDIANLFSNFTFLKDMNYKRIISAMKKYPYLTGGKNHVDSEIMKRSALIEIAKGGAEGIIIVAHKGNSAVVKIADGSARARSAVIIRLLVKLKWLKTHEIKNSILENILKGKIKNHAGKVTGKIYTLI